jgi:hypothetical protein
MEILKLDEVLVHLSAVIVQHRCHVFNVVGKFLHIHTAVNLIKNDVILGRNLADKRNLLVKFKMLG